jgi:hypothetical protein
MPMDLDMGNALNEPKHPEYSYLCMRVWFIVLNVIGGTHGPKAILLGRFRPIYPANIFIRSTA